MTKNRARPLFLLPAAICAIFLAACFSPWKGNEGTFSIAFGGGGARGITWPIDQGTFAKLEHTIALSGGPGPDQSFDGIKGNQTVFFAVTPGTWNISVKAYYENELCAVGEKEVEIKPGPNGSIAIQMEPVGDAVTSVSVSPSAISMVSGSTQQFSSVVHGTGIFTQDVVWNVTGWTVTGTAINSTGLLTVNSGETVGTVLTVAATSVTDPTKSGIAIVTIQEKINAQPPTITTNPAGATVTVGGTQSMTVAATSPDGGSLSYQWYSNSSASNVGGTLIGGATSPTYAAPISATGPYYFFVEVTNTISNNGDGGTKTASARSSAATLIVNAGAPTISLQPSGASYSKDASASALSVTAASPDGGTISYQWYYNTTDIANPAGATSVGTNSNTYTPSTATVGTLYYFVIVTNTNSSVNGTTTATATSDTAAVEIFTPVAQIAATGAAYPTLEAAIAAAPAGTEPSPTQINILASITSTGGYSISEKHIRLVVAAGSSGTITLADGNFPLFNITSGASLTLGTDTATGTLLLTGNNETANSNRRGVNVNGGKLTLNSNVTIQMFKGTGAGTGVYVYNSGSFTMNDGMVSGNDTSVNSVGGGAGVYVNQAGSEFYMNGGTIEGNIASGGGNGAGVYLNNSAAFYMSGGIIEGNIASTGSGGGVYVGTSSVFVMNGTAIIASNGCNNGGGVYLAGDSFTMTLGIIQNNIANTDGGGVYVNSGSFVMSNSPGCCIYGTDIPANANTGTRNGDSLFLLGGTSGTAVYAPSTDINLPDPVINVVAGSKCSNSTLGVP